jgi:hypothetical protein
MNFETGTLAEKKIDNGLIRKFSIERMNTFFQSSLSRCQCGIQTLHIGNMRGVLNDQAL